MSAADDIVQRCADAACNGCDCDMCDSCKASNRVLALVGTQRMRFSKEDVERAAMALVDRDCKWDKAGVELRKVGRQMARRALSAVGEVDDA